MSQSIILSHMKGFNFVSVYKNTGWHLALSVMQGHAKKVNKPFVSIQVRLRCWETWLHLQERILFISKLASTTKTWLLSLQYDYIQCQENISDRISKCKIFPLFEGNTNELYSYRSILVALYPCCPLYNDSRVQTVFLIFTYI